MAAPTELVPKPGTKDSTGPQIGAGDFNRRDDIWHQRRDEHVLTVGMLHYQAGVVHAARSSETFRPTREAILNQLDAKIRDRESRVFDEANYGTARETLEGRYEQADALPHTSQLERVRNRLAQFEGAAALVSDVDLTITTKSVEDERDYLKRLIPGSVRAEEIMEEQGREVFPVVFVTIWQPYLQDPEGAKLFRTGGYFVPIRNGVEEFFSNAQATGTELRLISANFAPFIEGVIEKIPGNEAVTSIEAVTADDITATQKGLIIEDYAKSDPNRPLIYIGDGESDIPAIDKDRYTSVVAAYFALEGSEFADALAERNLPYFSYRDFNDINKTLQQLGVFSPVTKLVA